MNEILGIIQVIGTLISVGTLMILGIKYMTGSVEQRASYKKSLLPYVIGSVLIFSAVNITAVIYNTVQKTVDTDSTTHGTPHEEAKGAYNNGIQIGTNLALEYLGATTQQERNKILQEYKDLLNDAEKKYNDACRENGERSTEAQERKSYWNGLQDGWNDTINPDI